MTTGIGRCTHSFSAFGYPELIRDGLAKPWNHWWNHWVFCAHATLTFRMASRPPHIPRTIAARFHAGSSVFDQRRTVKSP
jgi:hypothetical protein